MMAAEPARCEREAYTAWVEDIALKLDVALERAAHSEDFVWEELPEPYWPIGLIAALEEGEDYGWRTASTAGGLLLFADYGSRPHLMLEVVE